MPKAAFFAWPMAIITVAPPVIASPAAKTPGLLVWQVASSTRMTPHLFVWIDVSVEGIIGFTLHPNDITTVSQFSTKYFPVGTGFLLPVSSGSDNSICSQRICFTKLLSSTINSTGFESQRQLINSCSACFNSSDRAGASSRDRR